MTPDGMEMRHPLDAKTVEQDDERAERKAFEGLRAACAFAGFTLARSNPLDGPVGYWAGRWGRTVEMRSLADVAHFVERIGGVVGQGQGREP